MRIYVGIQSVSNNRKYHYYVSEILYTHKRNKLQLDIIRPIPNIENHDLKM